LILGLETDAIGKLRGTAVEFGGLRDEGERSRARIRRKQRTKNDPVVSSNGGGAVGTTSGIVVEGAGAPDARGVAMDLGVVNSIEVEAVEETTGVSQSGDALGETQTNGREIPRGVGESVEVAPEAGLIGSGSSLDEGVMRCGEKQAGGPGGEVTMSRGGESRTKNTEKA